MLNEKKTNLTLGRPFSFCDIEKTWKHLSRVCKTKQTLFHWRFFSLNKENTPERQPGRRAAGILFRVQSDTYLLLQLAFQQGISPLLLDAETDLDNLLFIQADGLAVSSQKRWRLLKLC